MDILAFGFRPWSQVERVGANVRDLQLANAIVNRDPGVRMLYVSRPVSVSEQMVRGVPYRLHQASLIASGTGWRLYRSHSSERIFALQIRSSDLISPVLQGRVWWATSLAARETRRAVEEASREIGLRSDVLLSWVPFAPEIRQYARGALYAHDMIDNFAKHARIVRPSEKAIALATHAAVASHADAITAVSKNALAALGVVRGVSRVLGNGVSAGWRTLTPECPDELERLLRRGPVVGTGGYLFEKFRGDVLRELALRMPDVSFVVIGVVLSRRVKEQIEGVQNIHVLGLKPFSRVPSFYHHFDVGFMFYEPTLENDGDPLKLYEMLACGTPVVSLPSNEVKERAGAVSVVTDAASAEKAIRSLLAVSRDARRGAARSALPVDATWEARADAWLENVRDAARGRRG